MPRTTSSTARIASAGALAAGLSKHGLVAEALSSEIVGGKYRVGDLLPSEPQLSQRFGVSRHTVRAALQTLQRLGLVSRNADMLGADLTPTLKKFDKPTLIVASSASFELTQQKAEVAALSHGSFAQIDHAAHGVFVDQPDAFNRILARFIKKT